MDFQLISDLELESGMEKCQKHWEKLKRNVWELYTERCLRDCHFLDG